MLCVWETIGLLTTKGELEGNSMNDDHNSHPDNNSKGKKLAFWDVFLTGGWSSFTQEWKNSKSILHTTLMFAVPILGAGIIVLLGILASHIFN